VVALAFVTKVLFACPAPLQLPPADILDL